MVDNPPEGMQRIIPHLSYADAPTAIDFLCRAFGFEERFRMPMPDGRVGHAELALDGNVVMLASVFEELGQASAKSLPAHHAMVVVYVDDVDAHHAQARAAGAQITRELEDQFYGDRTYAAADPEGQQWRFATHVRDVAPEDMVPPA
jgi:PhnB protein